MMAARLLAKFKRSFWNRLVKALLNYGQKLKLQQA